MTNWKPSVCDCFFTLDDGVVVGCSKGTQFDHHLLSDQAAYEAAIALSAAQPRPFMPVKPLYMRLALLEFELLEPIESALALPANKTQQIAFEYALQFERNDPMIVAFATAFGLTSQQIDNLFYRAMDLQLAGG